MSKAYTTEVFWSEEDDGFIAVAPDLPGCSAFGETRTEAASEIENAIEAWVQAAEAVGNPIPEPTQKKSFEGHSGKILLRMPKELHADLHAGAQEQGISLNSYACFLLASKHYKATAVQEFAKNLVWKSGAVVQSGVRTQIFHLCSPFPVETVQTSVSKSTNETSFVPITSFGVTQNA